MAVFLVASGKRGRPKGSLNKAKSPVKGTSAKEQKQVTVNSPEKKTYYCTACGEGYLKQAGNFRKSNSLFWKGNNFFIPVCDGCLDSFLQQYTDLYKDNDRAVKRLCMAFDWYVNDSLLAMSRRVNENQSRIGQLIKNTNLSQSNGKTYDYVISETQTAAINSMDEYDGLKEQGMISVTKASLERWGVGVFAEEDYKILDDHYRMLKQQNPNCDSNQEIFIKDLCVTKLLQLKAVKDKDTKDYEAMTKSYRETFKQAGLKTVVEADTSNEETLGVTLAVISQYTPEEYYKDKTLYKDFDGIGEMFKRFFVRPVKNLMTGSTERDEEFHVKEDTG